MLILILNFFENRFSSFTPSLMGVKKIKQLFFRIWERPVRVNKLILCQLSICLGIYTDIHVIFSLKTRLIFCLQSLCGLYCSFHQQIIRQNFYYMFSVKISDRNRNLILLFYLSILLPQ